MVRVWIAATDGEAQELFYPGCREIHDRIGALRGRPPLRREQFDAEVESGSLYVGSVETWSRALPGAGMRSAR
ncbi:hypothetical protein ACFWPH_19515 [Nocardia sp. NPDC058499]|uniref:hypothetical protein n=1 Tax=Nocardia sp. NPDC058499 TaxID=3346530 RepID=UPI003650A6A2